jgi:GAF domain-containing protein/RsbRD-like negative regulator of sigma factor
MESTGHPGAGVTGQLSEVEHELLHGLVDHLRQKRPELRQEWASRITDAQLLRVMSADEIFTEVTAVYDNYVNALETGSVEALRAYARDLSERIVRRGVETDEVLGTVLLLRDVLARALFVRHQGDQELLGRVLDVYEPAANRIAVTVGVSFVEERERMIREQQAAIRERAEMLHRLSTFLADASLALDAPGSLEEILQLVAEHARELVGAARCRAEIRLPDGTTVEAHAEAEPGADPVSVPPADVAALYAAVAPGRRSLRMSSAELADEPARRALEGAADPVRSMRSWLVASLGAPDGQELGLIQAVDKREGEFTHLDEEVLVQLAQMAATAVERAQRYAQEPRA